MALSMFFVQVSTLPLYCFQILRYLFMFRSSLPNIKKNLFLLGGWWYPMRSYPVKENPIGSAVSEILQYKQTHITQTSCYFSIGINVNFYLRGVKTSECSIDLVISMSSQYPKVNVCYCYTVILKSDIFLNTTEMANVVLNQFHKIAIR